jgi:hypothetical protein
MMLVFEMFINEEQWFRDLKFELTPEAPVGSRDEPHAFVLQAVRP